MKGNQILEAISELIQRYERKEKAGYANTCPLCILFQFEYGCYSCPNRVFEDSYLYPCVIRTEHYPKLNWREDDHELISYWNEVHKYLTPLLQDSDECELTEEMDRGILAIAFKFQWTNSEVTASTLCYACGWFYHI